MQKTVNIRQDIANEGKFASLKIKAFVIFSILTMILSGIGLFWFDNIYNGRNTYSKACIFVAAIDIIPFIASIILILKSYPRAVETYAIWLQKNRTLFYCLILPVFFILISIIVKKS